MKCIIYGIGSGRLKVERYLKNSHKIIGYSDSFYKGIEFNEKRFYKPEELQNNQFDIIIISIGDKETSNKIYNYLIKNGIEKRKILDFYSTYMYKYRRNRKLQIRQEMNSKGILDGIILGLSHSQFGINTNYLNGEFCNLSLGSQDLFYNLRTLEILVKNYGSHIKNLKYVIIDMHKYTYFNYDVSLSKNAITYYNNSGFRSNDCHNFYHNKNFKNSIEEEIECIKLKENKYYEDGTLALLDELLEDERISHITIEDIELYKNNNKLNSLQRNRFEDTIKENIQIFENIINLLMWINNKIKIYIILIPQYVVVEDFEENIEKKFKKEFYDILHSIKEKYQFKVLDFKKNKRISAEKKYYFDIRHLNNEGAIVFSKMLNSYIK